MSHTLIHVSSLSCLLWGSIGSALFTIGRGQRRHHAASAKLPGADDWRPSDPPIDADGFDNTLIQQGTVVVLFWATWDKSGRVMDSRLREARPALGDTLAFCSIDVDSEAHQEIVARCGILTTPTLIFFLNGKVSGHMIGARTVPDIEAQLQRWREAVAEAA